MLLDILFRVIGYILRPLDESSRRPSKGVTIPLELYLGLSEEISMCHTLRKHANLIDTSPLSPLPRRQAGLQRGEPIGYRLLAAAGIFEEDVIEGFEKVLYVGGEGFLLFGE